MRITKFIVFFIVISLSLSIALPAFAADGAATYKAKCTACHGPEGQGKIGPAVKGISLSADQMRAHRGTLTEPGRNSPYRDRPVEENIDLFARMRAGAFPAGAHVLRIQQREDGPSIDQIVLSPDSYVGSAPGPHSDDATILPASVTAGPSSLLPRSACAALAECCRSNA